MGTRHNHSKIAVDENPVNGSCNRKNMIRKILINVLIMSITLLLTLILLEMVVRVGGATDADGQFSFMGYALEPYILPVSAMRESVETYVANRDLVTIVYDPDTGWAYRPNSIRHNGTFTVNSGGLRATREYSQSPLPDTLRIALFGDSFTADDDVSDKETWGNQLEMALNQSGIRAETLNFGVGGYGMDQSYLRWRKVGRGYQPDIVIFGFQPENLDRNVNVFRHLYIHGFGIPLSKPRFLLADSRLELINLPAVPPEQLIRTFESFASHPLAHYEAYYRSRIAASSWWAGSRLIAFIHEALKPRAPLDATNFGPGSERGELGKAIVDAFAADVAATGADFIIAHLPLQQHLVHLQGGGDPPFAYLQDYFATAYHYVPLENHLGGFTADRYHGTTGHYLPEVSLVVAQALASEVETCVRDGSCRLPRFADRSAFVVRDR